MAAAKAAAAAAVATGRRRTTMAATAARRAAAAARRTRFSSKISSSHLNRRRRIGPLPRSPASGGGFSSDGSFFRLRRRRCLASAPTSPPSPSAGSGSGSGITAAVDASGGDGGGNGNDNNNIPAPKKLQESTDEVWRRLTARLLSSPSPAASAASMQPEDGGIDASATAATWTKRSSDVVSAIQWWTQRRPVTRESAEASWRLWQLLLDLDEEEGEKEGGPSNEGQVDSEITPGGRDNRRSRLLESVLEHWYLGVCDGGTCHYVTSPREAFERVIASSSSSSSCVAVTCKTAALILSAASRCRLGGGDDVDPQLGTDVLEWYFSLPADRRDDGVGDGPVVICNAALTLWGKRSRSLPGADGEALKLLRRMQSEWGVRPNVRSYACVLQAFANSLSHKSGGNGSDTNRAAEQAVELFDEMLAMQRRQQEGGGGIGIGDGDGDEVEGLEDAVKPNDVCALHLLTALARSGQVEKAHALLEGWVDEWQRCGPGGSTIRPTPHLFSIIMAAYASQGEVEKVRELLQKLHHFLSEQRRQQQQDGGNAATSSSSSSSSLDNNDADAVQNSLTTALNSVLEAYANNNSPQQAETIINRMLEQQPDWIDLTSINTVLNAWARVSADRGNRKVSRDNNNSNNKDDSGPDPVERAEALLQAAIKHGFEPDVVSYTTVMKAWARSDHPDAARRCEAFLQAMWDACDEDRSSMNVNHRDSRGRTSLQPTAITYSTILYAWSRSSANDAPLRAEAVFRDQVERYKDGNFALMPTEQTYVTLMTTWNRHHNIRRRGKRNVKVDLKAAARTQYYFDTLRAQSMAKDIPLSNRAYHALLESKKRVGDALAATAILKQMLEDYERGNDLAKPTRYTFHSVLQAWASFKSSRAPKRALALMRQMESWSKKNPWRHSVDCKPVAATYAIVLQCFSQSDHPDAPEQAQALLRRMEELGRNDESIRPNSFCYGLVLQAWSHSRLPQSAESAQKLMEEMWDRYYQGGEEQCRPNSTAYTSLLTAWSRSPNKDAAFKALAVLNEMHDRFNQAAMNNSRGVIEAECPKGYHYSAVIHAFARSGDAENARALVQRLEDDPYAQPNLGCYHGFMLALLKSPAGQQRDAVEEIDAVLRRLRHPSSRIRPTPAVIATAIDAWQGPSHPDAINRAKAILQEYMQDLSFSKSGARHYKSSDEAWLDPFLSFLRVVSKSSVLSREEKELHVQETLAWIRGLGVLPTKAIMKGIEACRSSSSTVIHGSRRGREGILDGHDDDAGDGDSGNGRESTSGASLLTSASDKIDRDCLDSLESRQV